MTFPAQGRGRKLIPRLKTKSKTKQKTPSECKVEETGQRKQVIRYVEFSRKSQTHTLFCPPLFHQSHGELNSKGWALDEDKRTKYQGSCIRSSGSRKLSLNKADLLLLSAYESVASSVQNKTEYAGILKWRKGKGCP